MSNAINNSQIKDITMLLLLITGLAYVSFNNYLLFHTSIELFSIVIAFNMFIMAVSTFQIAKNDLFTFLGLAYGFIAGIDLLHTLAYKGMGVLVGYSANLPTQLWIIARYLESITLLIAFLFLHKRLDKHKLIVSYVIVSMLGLLSIFYWELFPDCYIAGVGLTFFKRISEYIIIGILGSVIILLKHHKKDLNPTLYYFMLWSAIATILAELMFTFYINIYGLSNMLGHIFKLISFYFIYKAVNENSLQQPYQSLFNKLQTKKQKLEKEKNKLQKYLNILDGIFVVLNKEGQVKLINQQGCKLLGYAQEKIIGQDWFDKFVTSKEKEVTKNAFISIVDKDKKTVKYLTNDIVTNEGLNRTIAWNNSVLENEQGEVEEIISVGTKIDDPVTGLPAISYFKQQLRIEVEHLSSKNELALFILEIDDLTVINQSFGRETGNQILKELTNRLQETLDYKNNISRNGNEFFLYFTGIKDKQETIILARKILTKLKCPYIISEEVIYLTSIKMGIAVYPKDGNTSELIFKNAKLAKNVAENQKGNDLQLYSSNVGQKVSEKINLKNDLILALEKEEFILHYQPLVDAATKKIIGVEVLIRWQHPAKGIIPPNKFIPIAKELGIIIEIGNWVLKQACERLKEWHQLGYQDLFISVNIAAQQFQDEKTINRLEEILIDTGLDPTQLYLEITERTAIENTEHTLELVTYLNNLGVNVAIDDFGTGYSSLFYLREFPIQTLKIDKSFIQQLTKKNKIIAETIIMIANNLNLKVVGEGVETKAGIEFLNSKGCDILQGYFFSKPLPEDELINLLKKNQIKSE